MAPGYCVQYWRLRREDVLERATSAGVVYDDARVNLLMF